MAAALERVGSGFSDNPALDILRQRFGERATSGQAICDQHGRGEGWYPSAPPDLVVFA